MSINDYRDPIVTQWESSGGVKYSKPISNEPHVVTNGMFALVGIPDEQARVQISGLVEIGFKDMITEATQFKVDYTNGYVFVHSSKEGLTINVSYFSRGVNMYPASRVWSEININGDVTETLKDVIDTGKTLNDSITQAETIRKGNESTRVDSENIRRSSELDREATEQSRVISENSRVTAEDTRKSNEVERVVNEIDRVQAENKRESDFTQAIDDFVAETERVEAIYPTRLTKVENDLVQHKLDYMPHKMKLDGKDYKYGLTQEDGFVKFIYEEVV